jgi:uncharacterized protein
MAYVRRGGHGGVRPGAGRRAVGDKKPNPNKPRQPAETKLNTRAPAAPAEPKTEVGPAIDPRAWAMMLPEIEEISRKYAVKQARTTANNPFQLPAFPRQALPPENLTMAMDSALTNNFGWGANNWMAGDPIDSLSGESLLFLGYTYLSELAQRPEYRIISETIADDATRKWIDFDVVGDEQKQQDDREKDPAGYDERMADPDERTKRVAAAGKTDKVKALKDDQLRLQVKDRYYDQVRNGGFFGRSHLFHDIRTNDSPEISPEELKSPIGDSRDATSKSKVPINSFKGLRTIEPVWTYPLMYNAINPLREDWYNPQVWYVMGQEIHGTRLQTFIPHPVPDMLKPAYAFGGLSLTQMSKPYVDRWLTTVSSVNQLIHSFSVMVLMTDLSTLMQPNNVGALVARVAMFNMMRDNQGAFVLNKNTEDFKNVSASLAGLHELQAQSQEHMAFPSRLPLVKMTGIQPAGLNASSEGEIEVYDDTIGAFQARVCDPNLRRTINFQQLSLWGEIDPEISHRWEALRPMTQSEKGQKEKDDADRNQKYVDMGAISPGEVRQIIVDDPELPYTGLNPEDVPEPPAEEGVLGPGAGGAAAAFEKDATGQGGESDTGGGANDAGGPFAHDAGFVESEHPRAPDGKFGSGGGGGSSSAKQMGEGSAGSNRKSPGAAALYSAPTRTADQIVASFPGATAAIDATRKKIAALVPTDALVSEGGFKNPDGTYTAEREAIHRKIAAEFFPADRVAAALPKAGEKPVLTVLGGRGGSGKSWLTGQHGPVNGDTSILIDSDAIKAKLPGYEGWNASSFHEESTHILNMVDQRAMALGVSTIHDATLKSEATSAMRMAQYEAAGYEIEGYYMYAAPETAATRALSRYSKKGTFTGRFVPPEIILGNTNNEKNFDKMSGGFRKWAVYDNNAEGSAGPKLVSRSHDD